MKNANSDYDSVWKQALACYVHDFAELFLREQWEGAAPPVSEHAELAKCGRGGEFGLLRVDKLLRAMRPDGSPCLWHIEVQVARQRHFAERMFVCHYRLYDHFRLPIRSIAVLGDPSPTWRPASFRLDAGGTRLSLDFESFKLRDFEDRLAELLLSDNVFAWLVTAHLLTLRTRREPFARMVVKCSLLTGLRSCGWGRRKFCDVFDLIERMMTLPEAIQARVDQQQQELDGRPDMAWKYLWEERAEERGLERGLERGIAAGRQEGRQEGRMVALRDMLCAQLTQRFGTPAAAVRSRVDRATTEELERWCLAVVTARTIDDVFR